MSTSLDKLLQFFVERPDTAFSYTEKTVSKTSAPLSVAAGTNGSIILSWGDGSSLTIPCAQRETFLKMVEKAVKMSQAAVPPQP